MRMEHLSASFWSRLLAPYLDYLDYLGYDGRRYVRWLVAGWDDFFDSEGSLLIKGNAIDSEAWHARGAIGRGNEWEL
jgi:hypothetical protein